MTDADDFGQVWDERKRALEAVLGPVGDGWHAPIPFDLGGTADVLAFPEHLNGVVYVTADLTRPEPYADYELMIALRSGDHWGAEVVSRLAPYTQEAVIASGESMDIDSATPADSAIEAFVFDTYARFEAFGRTFDLRLCLGITKEELAFKLAHGADALLARLKAAGVHPFTDLARSSVPLAV